MTALVRRRAQAVPRCATVSTDLARRTSLLEHLERRADSPLELRGVYGIELLLGVVQVVEIDRVKSQIRAAARDLVLEKCGSEAVTAGDDVLGTHDSGIEILASHVVEIVFAFRGLRSVERDVAALRADHELVARCRLHSHRARERFAESALGALAPIVDRTVEQVDPRRDRVVRGVCVTVVVRVVALTEIAAEADGGDEHAIGGERTEKVGRELGGDARAKARGALGGGVAGEHCCRRARRCGGHDGRVRKSGRASKCRAPMMRPLCEHVRFAKLSR